MYHLGGKLIKGATYTWSVDTHMSSGVVFKGEEWTFRVENESDEDLFSRFSL